MGTRALRPRRRNRFVSGLLGGLGAGIALLLLALLALRLLAWALMSGVR